MSQLQTDPIDLQELDDLISDSIPHYYVPNRKKQILRDDKIQCIFIFGQRGAGKSVTIDEYSQWYYNHGITPLYLWSARSNENVVVCVNKNCKRRWDQTIQKYEIILKNSPESEKLKIHKKLERAKNYLHCNCHKSYPVSWLVPDYWEFSGVRDFNNNWSDKHEYLQALEDGKITKQYYELTLKERQMLDQRQLKKPNYLIKTDMMRICPFTIPTKGNEQTFAKQFIKYLLEARKERRWLVMNPLMFLTQDEKFKTISYIITHLQYWMEEYFQPLTEQMVGKLRGLDHPVPEHDWVPHERNWHKAALVFTELRTIAPTNKFSPETKSGLSKRSIVDISAELRHKNLYLIGDLQNSEDLNESIKPLSDFVIIKNATQQLLGKEYYYFIEGIEKQRKKILSRLSHGKYSDFAKAPMEYKVYVDGIRPRVQELPVNKAYAVWPNNEFKLITVNGPSWHHKQEGESLQSLTGITWKLRDEALAKLPRDLESESDLPQKSEKRLKNYDINKVLRWCVEEFIRVKGWPKVVENLKMTVQKGDLPSTTVDNLDHKLLSNKIRKDEKMRMNLDTAKKMKDREPDEIIKALKW